MMLTTTLLALVIAFTVVCRAVKMSQATDRQVRWSFAALATAAFALALLPWVRPDLFDEAVAALLAALVWGQYATARLWSKGVPNQFQTRKGVHS